MHRHVKTLGVAFAAALSLGVFIAPAKGHQDSAASKAMMNKMMSGPSMRRLHNSTGRNFEIAFLSEMVEHHQDAIKMSRMALQGAKRAQVRKEARKVMEDQRKEIQRMMQMLRRLHRRSPDPNLRALMRRDGAPMMAQFRRDCREGCDEAFLMHMKMHHQMGIHMAQLAARKSVNGQVRNFARNTIAKQSSDNKRFEALLHSDDHSGAGQTGAASGGHSAGGQQSGDHH